MEIDLIRYRNKYKMQKISDNAAYMKISRKFIAKGYANISRKSIKYKYEKLQASGRIQELEAEASLVIVESDEEIETRTGKKSQTKKKFSTWDEEMEVLLLNLVNRLRMEHPALSENSIFRRVTRDLQREGYANLTEHIVLYHHRKLKQNTEKFHRLMEQSRGFDEMPSDSWTKPTETAMLHYHNKFKQRMLDSKPMEIYAKIRHQLEASGHGNFSEISIRNRYLTATQGFDDHESMDSQTDLQKRNYLYWTEEMKEALIRYREVLKERPGLTELWENVAKMMRDDGYGDFTADNVKYKYFNLKRRKENSIVVEAIESDEL